MNQHFLKEKDGQKLQDRFLELRKELSNLEWIIHGSVTPNHPGNWRWTTKVKAKTVTLSLSAEQADLFKEAIAANRKVESKPGVILDYDANGNIVGLEILNASKRVDNPKAIDYALAS